MQGRSLGYGFVHFETDLSAKNAIEATNGKVIGNDQHGRAVVVQAFKSKTERGQNNARFTNVFFKHFPEGCTQEDLEKKAGVFGTITSTHFPMDSEGKSRGYALINYEDSAAASEAVDRLNGEAWGERPLYVAPGQKKEEREKELRSRLELKKQELQKKSEGVNLYVKYLTDDITDDRLSAEFQRFGNIVSAKVMCDNNRKSKGFGFVCFSSPEEATKAVTEMNGYSVNGKPLYVALAQRKEVRRAQLEAQYLQRKPGSFPAPHIFPQAPMLAYQGMPQRMNIGMYPPTMPLGAGPRRFPNQGGPMSIRGLGQQPVVHSLMPMQSRQPQPGRQRPGRRQGQQGTAGRQQGQPGQPFKYNNNVRNQQPVGDAAPVGVGHPIAIAETTRSSSIQEVIAALGAAPNEDSQKNILGERLFPLIEQTQGKLAGKITGMLLEMDNNELINLLESRQALNEKIEEALDVLKQHEE